MGATSLASSTDLTEADVRFGMAESALRAFGESLTVPIELLKLGSIARYTVSDSKLGMA